MSTIAQTTTVVSAVCERQAKAVRLVELEATAKRKFKDMQSTGDTKVHQKQWLFAFSHCKLIAHFAILEFVFVFVLLTA